MKKFLFCFGTRPEAIKMASVIKEVTKRGHKAIICISGQHRDMIRPFLNFFDLIPDFDLDIMQPNQTLSSMTSSILLKMQEVLNTCSPDYVLVQGDTTTTFTCALSAFYHQIPVVHIEAGLRTGDIYSPFPEECNRKLVSAFAKYHFAPTQLSLNNLLQEGITSNVIVSGNTSIDSLRLTMDIINDGHIDVELCEKYRNIDFKKKLVMVTVHRRENHGEPLINICNAILELSKDPELQFLIPVHLNPNVKTTIHSFFNSVENVHLCSPLDYIDFTWLMSKSFLILTDSGGVQEEGPYFKKPILVLRENTERPEGILANVSKLVGNDKNLIISQVNKLVSDDSYYSSFTTNQNPYGEGFAASIIIDHLLKA